MQLISALGIGVVGFGMALGLHTGRVSVEQLGAKALILLVPFLALVPLVVLVRRTSATAQAWRLAIAYFLIAFIFVFLRQPHETPR